MNGSELNNRGELEKKGELLIVQGENPKYMYYLHSGTLEILSSRSEYEGLDADIILSKSKRVGIIKGETLISGLSILFAGPYKKSIRVLEDSYVSRYPLKEGGINQIASENPSLTITILAHLFRRLEQSISDASKYTKLYQQLCMIDDNISLIYKALSKSDAIEKLNSRAESLYNRYLSSGGDAQGKFDAKFLITDNSSLLKKKYSFPGLPMESLIDSRQCSLIKKFLRLNSHIFVSVIKEDPSIPVAMFEVISDNILKVLDRIESIHNEIDDELSILFGSDSSWSSYLVDERGFDEINSTNGLSPDFIKGFLSLVRKIHSYYNEISGKNLIETYTGCKKLHEYYISKKVDFSKTGEGEPVTKKTSIEDSCRNSLQQIFEFGLIDKEFQMKFLEAINSFKRMHNPFNTEQDGRKVRRSITKMYWDLFKQIYIRKQKESVIPTPVKLMINFGFLDETFLEDNQIAELQKLSCRIEEKSDIPILFEDEFLTKIYLGEETPSITEMGLSYEAYLREEAKSVRMGKKKSELAVTDDNVKKAMYEIDHRLATTVAVCSGSTATAFPILTSMVMKGDPASFFTSPKKLESIVKSLKEVDFSVFYRETVVKLSDAREVIQEEVVPNFIILPAFGTKTMLWQELDGKNRKTRGRIVVPIIFIGDFMKSLTHTFACFRWELNRTIKGGMWADPVDGGLTGAYFDYVNFYKKNSKLSVETKEKITEKFKGLRTNRDRFANDYMMWVLFEKDGIMRLNSVTREMFYRHIPFRKELRAKLENMPAFGEISTRYKNIHSKNIAAYERKFKKYMDDDGILPESLSRFMEFLNS